MHQESVNTPSVTIEEQTYPIRVGEDTAKVCLYLSWSDKQKRETVFALLAQARKAAEGGSEEESVIEIAGSEWSVSPHGIGGRSGMPYMAYSLSMSIAPDIVLSLRDADYSEQCINGMLDVGSLSLICKGSLASIWRDISEDLNRIGAVVTRNILSRVDVAIDIGGYHVSPFVDKLRENCIVGGGRYDTEHVESTYRESRVPTGITCGKKNRSLWLRIYDKIKDMERGNGYLKRDALQYLMGVNEIMTRIEFEMRREQFQYWNREKYFPDGEIHGVEDWHTLRPWVIQEVMSEWVRLTNDTPDRDNNHQSRAEEWAVWTAIRERAVQILKDDKAVELERPQPHQKDGTHLLAQALGCMTSYLAGYCPSGVDVETAKRCAKVFTLYAKTQREHCEIKYRQLMKKLGKELAIPDCGIPF